MTEFRTIPLETALSALLDYRGKSPKKAANGIPVISAKVVKNGLILSQIEQRIAPDYYPVWMVRGLPQVGDVVLTTEGPLGEVAQLDEDTVNYALGQRVVALRGTAGVLDNTFLKYLLLSSRQQAILASYATGTTVEGVSQKALRSLPITIPDFSSQERIASVLATLDARIDNNRRMNRTLEAMVRSVFKDWFIDFGPTRRKSDGESAYLADEVWQLFPDQFNSEIVPNGWRTGTLASLVDVNCESWSATDHPDDLEYVDLANTKWGIIESTASLAWETAPSRARRTLRRGDTIVGTVRPGNGSYALVDRDGLTGSTGFAVLRPKHPTARTFVYCAATSKDNIDRLSHLADGGAYPAVRPDTVSETPITIPPPPVLEGFEAMCSPLIRRYDSNKIETSALIEVRDLLLPRLLSGELSVRDMENVIAQTV